MTRRTPEADIQRAIVHTLRVVLPRDAIIHHAAKHRGDRGHAEAEAMGAPVETRTTWQRALLTELPLLTHTSSIEEERPKNSPSQALTCSAPSALPPALVPPRQHPYSGGAARKFASVRRFYRGIQAESTRPA